LVSVEMIEAVGHEYFDTFFEVCKNRLKPGGRMALQAITIRNHLYESYRRSSDFIRHFIFPGGCLPSLDVITSSLGRVTDFSVRDVDSFGQHYVRTLRIWKDKFRQNRHRVEDLGYPESFQRMWEFYLNYCEGGFLEGIIDNHQIVLSREDVSGQGTVE